MNCLYCQNCYSHSFNYTQTKYRCKQKGHREIDNIPESEKGKKCTEFVAKALPKK
jgi:hypothetical protein